MIIKTCPTCSKEFRALSQRDQYCNMVCFRARPRMTKKQISKNHSIYLKKKMAEDPEFRARRLANKASYYHLNKERIDKRQKELRATEQYKKYRNSYLQRDSYKEYKKSYDHQYRLQKQYGDFWEAASALIAIENLVRPHKYEIRKENDTLNKTLKRSRNGTVKRSYT